VIFQIIDGRSTSFYSLAVYISGIWQPFSSPFANRFRPSSKLAGIQRELKKFEFIEE